MLIKKLILFSCLAYLGQSAPVAESGPEANIEAKPQTLKTRGDEGIWLNFYHSGSCDSGLEDQPTSGWVWYGQCKNLEPNTYGAKVGPSPQDGTMPWNEMCILKFWENEDCRGRATTVKVKNVAHNHDYKCIATANRGKEFYLPNGASSVMLIC